MDGIYVTGNITIVKLPYRLFLLKTHLKQCNSKFSTKFVQHPTGEKNKHVPHSFGQVSARSHVINLADREKYTRTSPKLTHADRMLLDRGRNTGKTLHTRGKAWLFTSPRPDVLPGRRQARRKEVIKYLFVSLTVCWQTPGRRFVLINGFSL